MLDPGGKGGFIRSSISGMQNVGYTTLPGISKRLNLCVWVQRFVGVVKLKSGIGYVLVWGGV